MKENKRGTAEDFIGWKSEDGLLEVVGIYGKQEKITTFKVICHKCKEDKELFPDGYFVSTKGNLIKGRRPCGCSKQTRWKYWQFIMLSHRAAKDRFIVHGFAEEFHGAHTKLSLECLVDGHIWESSIDNVLRNRGCPLCRTKNNAEHFSTPEHAAIKRCIDICDEMNYEFIRLVDGYNGSHKTKIEYKCQKHGLQNVSYNNFVNNGTRCIKCWRGRQRYIIRYYSNNKNGYYPDRKDEKDFLYVLDFNGEYIKVGRSFKLNRRFRKLKALSKVPVDKIYKLRIFTATHQEIYDTEQEIIQ